MSRAQRASPLALDHFVVLDRQQQTLRINDVFNRCWLRTSWSFALLGHDSTLVLVGDMGLDPTTSTM